MTILITGVLCLLFPWLIPAVVGYMLGGFAGVILAYVILGVIILVLAGFN